MRVQKTMNYDVLNKMISVLPILRHYHKSLVICTKNYEYIYKIFKIVSYFENLIDSQ